MLTPVLEGSLVRLEPLDSRHAADLAEAAGVDRETFTWTSVPDGLTDTEQFVGRLLERSGAGELVPFVQVSTRSGRPVGWTAFLNLRRLESGALYAVEIGHTWLGRSAQRTGVNTEAKLLLMAHAFEEWSVARVDLKTDARNERSRQAIARLGATFEGVLRNWQPSHAAGEAGLLRDTAMFSVTAGEWPAVKAGLQNLTQRTR